MAELDLDALEQAAREAGGGCWFSAGWTAGSRGFEVGDLKSRNRICSAATERCAEFIAAANPAVISELLDRLEAAEKERDNANAAAAGVALHAGAMQDRLEAAEADALEQARLNGMGSEREAALMAKLEAAEKSDAESLAMYRKARDERDALRAKIAEMEQQEPIGEMLEVSPHNYELRWYRPVPFGAKLYTLPGAKGEEK